MNIALALSGGGFRATVFHLGVLARLAEEKRLEEVTLLSTVSGGSLCTGLVYALNGMRWPTSEQYIKIVLPQAQKLLITEDFQRDLLNRALSRIWTIFQTRANLLSALIQQRWGITAKLNELPDHPRWMINATCYETGKDWRFERFRMGDYVFGYTSNPAVPLSDAMAASAGFPGLIGPLTLDATKYEWFQYEEEASRATSPQAPGGLPARKTRPVQPMFPSVHLWDGGVYDNHGLEGVHDFTKGWLQGVDFLVVSDAAGRPRPAKYQRGARALKRLATDIMMDQIRSLRSRAIVERLVNHKDRGVFLQTGNTSQQVLGGAGKQELLPQIEKGCLSQQDAIRVAEMPTVISKLPVDTFRLLMRHGFEVADYTLFTYFPDLFHYLGYANSQIRSE